MHLRANGRCVGEAVSARLKSFFQLHLFQDSFHRQPRRRNRHQSTPVQMSLSDSNEAVCPACGNLDIRNWSKTDSGRYIHLTDGGSLARMSLSCSACKAIVEGLSVHGERSGIYSDSVRVKLLCNGKGPLFVLLPLRFKHLEFYIHQGRAYSPISHRLSPCNPIENISLYLTFITLSRYVNSMVRYRNCADATSNVHTRRCVDYIRMAARVCSGTSNLQEWEIKASHTSSSRRVSPSRALSLGWSRG